MTGVPPAAPPRTPPFVPNGTPQPATAGYASCDRGRFDFQMAVAVANPIFQTGRYPYHKLQGQTLQKVILDMH